MKKQLLTALIAVAFLAACSENSTDETGAETNETTEDLVDSSKTNEASDYYVGEGEARVGDTYETFVEAFGEDTSDTEGIGFFQNHAIWINTLRILRTPSHLILR